MWQSESKAVALQKEGARYRSTKNFRTRDAEPSRQKRALGLDQAAGYSGQIC
mgnify:CR=1 FL=1